MSYTLTLGTWHVVTDAPGRADEACDCATAKVGCMPSFVFSIAGQVGFRVALHHLASCQRTACRTLRAHVFSAMKYKMRWLMEERYLLGCVHIQPSLYGRRHIVMERRDFPAIARHLALCPKDSCAQLRRAVLLDIRDELRPQV